jgi:hypothetical protein
MKGSERGSEFSHKNPLAARSQRAEAAVALHFNQPTGGLPPGPAGILATARSTQFDTYPGREATFASFRESSSSPTPSRR